jgi:uncharacterized protein
VKRFHLQDHWPHSGWKIPIALLSLLAIAYSLFCFYLLMRQRALIFNPQYALRAKPDDPEFQMPFESVQIDVKTTGGQIKGWWIPAVEQRSRKPLTQSSVSGFKSRKVLLYFHGRGSNRSYSLYRMQGLHQLGFSVLTLDYRGYGDSIGAFPSEFSVYEDSQAAWNYLTQVRRVPGNEIVIYGESLGGAVALDLAVKQPDAGGLVLQSTFTSMTSMIRRIPWFQFLPVDWILTERFDSLAKVRSLKVPVLFLHGQTDDVVPAYMSDQLYRAAPEPKKLFLIPAGSHFTIYKPGRNSYLEVMRTFLMTHMETERI